MPTPLRIRQVIYALLGLTVGVGGTLIFGLPAKFTGTVELAGSVSSTAVVKEAYSSYAASSASSQVLCSIPNTGVVPRVLKDVFLTYATNTATGGNYAFTVSLSSAANTTGTGSNLLYYNTLAAPTNGIRNVTVSSTLSGFTTSTPGAATAPAPALWFPGTYLNFMIASPTTTLGGDCRASYL